jgi:hypothetical protein
VNILHAVADPKLFGAAFRGESWAAWRAALAALFALPMSDEDLKVYHECTGRKRAPTGPAREAWLVCGRRGGKSRIAALVAVYLAASFSANRERLALLAPGEIATVMLLATDRRQARVVFRYVEALVDGSALLAREVTHRTRDSLRLGRVEIEVHVPSLSSTRGYSILALVADEIAFWPADEFSANPDEEVLAAMRPAMSTIPDSLLLAISTPYARRGALWTAFDRHYGNDGGDVLVWKAPTRVMNPRVPQALVDRALEEDEPRARAEYLAEFRRDVETFVSLDAVEACVVLERRELLPASSLDYVAFCDPAGGSGSDSFTLAVAHQEGDRVVLDAVRERRPPFSPDAAVEEFSQLLRSYRVSQLRGDRWGGSWVAERFARFGISYEVASLTKSELYAALLPAINSARVELLDDRRLLAQLVGLERRTSRGGRDVIDHGLAQHDDVVNAAAGAVYEAGSVRAAPFIFEEL